MPLTIRLVALPENAEQPPAPRAPQPDPATVEMLKASFAWHSPRAALEKVPAKVSVSACLLYTSSDVPSWFILFVL